MPRNKSKLPSMRKSRATPMKLLNIVFDKFVIPFLTKLKAGAKSWVSTIIGIAMIILGIFDGESPNREAIMGGIALIFVRDGDKSSQDSGVRPIPIK